jgi:hypothetical protein
MRITFGNATVKRLEFEQSIAEGLNHLRFFKITECRQCAKELWKSPP